MVDLEFIVTDLAGNQSVPFTVSIAVTGGIIPITGTISSNYVIPAGDTHEAFGLVLLDHCSIDVDGGVFRLRSGATVRGINMVHTDYVTGQQEDPVLSPGIHFRNGGQADWLGTEVAVPWTDDGIMAAGWSANDEYIATPHVKGSITANPYTFGDPVPAHDFDDVTPTRICHLTRSPTFEGQPGAHMFVMFHPTAGLDINRAYCTFRYLGIPTDTSRERDNIGVMGFFSVHDHKRGDLSRGLLIKGNVFRDCLNSAIWLHGCHGVTMIDNIVYKTEINGIGWDINGPGHASDDMYLEGNMIVQIEHTQGYRNFLAHGLVLALGDNIVVGPRNVITGVNGDGDRWPERSPDSETYIPWIHNFPIKTDYCTRHCVDMWQNATDFTDDFTMQAMQSHVGMRYGAYLCSFRVGIDCHHLDTMMEIHALPSGVGNPEFHQVGRCDNMGTVFSLEKATLPSPTPEAYKIKDFDFVNCNVLFEDKSADNNGSLPRLIEVRESKWDGVDIVDLLSDGTTAPTNIYTNINSVPGNLIKFQNGATAFEIDYQGMVATTANF